MSSQDLSDIIKTSAQNGVSKLTFGDLQIEFGKKTEPQDPEKVLEVSRAASTPDNAISDQDHERQNARALEDDELTLREEQLAEMLITDPFKAEQMLLDGELEDDDESDDQSE